MTDAWQKTIFFGGLAAFIAFMAVANVELFIQAMPVVLIAAFIVLILLSESGMYPFGQGRKIRSKGALVAATIAILFAVQSLGQLPPTPWYPYPSPLLIVLPLAVYLLVAGFRRGA